MRGRAGRRGRGGIGSSVKRDEGFHGLVGVLFQRHFLYDRYNEVFSLGSVWACKNWHFQAAVRLAVCGLVKSYAYRFRRRLSWVCAHIYLDSRLYRSNERSHLLKDSFSQVSVN